MVADSWLWSRPRRSRAVNLTRHSARGRVSSATESHAHGNQLPLALLHLQSPQFFQPVRDALLDAAVGREVVLAPGERWRQAFHVHHRILELVGVLVAFRVAPLLHVACYGI